MLQLHKYVSVSLVYCETECTVVNEWKNFILEVKQLKVL